MSQLKIQLRYPTIWRTWPLCHPFWMIWRWGHVSLPRHVGILRYVIASILRAPIKTHIWGLTNFEHTHYSGKVRSIWRRKIPLWHLVTEFSGTRLAVNYSDVLTPEFSLVNLIPQFWGVRSVQFCVHPTEPNFRLYWLLNLKESDRRNFPQVFLPQLE